MGAVLAVEYNGWQGSQLPLISALSRWGRAASMFWNVNALTQSSLAEGGEILDSFEPGIRSRPEVVPLFDDLDLADYRDRVGKGLVVVERFVGRGLRPDDLARIEETDVAYRITSE